MDKNVNYYFVAAKIGSDKVNEFLKQNKWEFFPRNNDKSDSTYLRALNIYNEVKPGDKLIIKTTTPNEKLPLDAQQTFANYDAVKHMTIGPVGTVTVNPKDGQTLAVNWDTAAKPRDWYFYIYRPYEIIWSPLATATTEVQRRAAEQLIDFSVAGESQNYEWFLKQPEFNGQKVNNSGYNTTSMSTVAKYATDLKDAKNLILRGAPGTGKTYLAKEIAAYLISNHRTTRLSKLRADEKEQYSFVQFHPSYDYTDFVEGLRPKANENGFELQPGSFTRFINKAVANWQDASKSPDDLTSELTARKIVNAYFADMDYTEKFHTLRGTEFSMGGIENDRIDIAMPDNDVANHVSINVSDLVAMLKAYLNGTASFAHVKDITNFFNKENATQGYSYDLAVFQNIIATVDVKPDKSPVAPVAQKKYVFVIDEINRGEISKIFGELFYSIDPGYRGDEDGVLTQYANLHDDPERKFYIPKNVYIIGTMNDIDRSVDTFDFAMRRRFAFDEVTAAESADNMQLPTDVVNQMQRLNDMITSSDGADLPSDYQIGASYFLKLRAPETDPASAPLWNKQLKPLFRDYLRGEHNMDKKLKALQKAYFNQGAE